MPDVHVGKGAAVGAVIPTRAAIIPAAVGVDIGCGMVAVRTTLKASDLPDSLAAIRAQIERDVPVGFAMHRQAAAAAWQQRRGRSAPAPHRRSGAALRGVCASCIASATTTPARVWCQLGTLGGGNHFIELCLDEDDAVWVMLHSGSRNIGNTIGEVAIATARRIAEREHRHLPDRDLAWLSEGTLEFDEYVEGRGVGAGLRGAQSRPHARPASCGHCNGSSVASASCAMWPSTVITTTPAWRSTSARRCGSPAKAPYRPALDSLASSPVAWGRNRSSCAAKGNPAAYHSCSHGAGRRMSRSEAKRRFTSG